eukprot:m.256376 g.256376  ORF g.256376 m.256376 type:complete len:308 (+) comp26570_c0_seq15:6114-7037(+)
MRNALPSNQTGLPWDRAMPKRPAGDIDLAEPKRAKAEFPERPTLMTRWLHDYDSIQVSGQPVSMIWSNSEASGALAGIRAIVKSEHLHSRDPDHTKYSEYLQCALVTDALVEHMCVPHAVDDLVSVVRFKLAELVDAGEYGAAMALLVYPHRTGDAFLEHYGIVPRVVEHPGPDCTTYRFIWFDDSEKDKTLDRNDRRPKPRLIPIVPGVCDDPDMLLKICDQGRGHMRDGLYLLRPWLASLGLPDDVRSARKLGTTLLFQWLVTSARDLVDLAPLAYLTWLNLALGHRPRSNQWASYLCGWRAPLP